MAKPRVWFITGVSSGLGREIAKEAAAHGETVIGTVRKKEQVKDFETIAPGLTFAYVLDVTERAKVFSTIKSVIDKFGHLDVVVNNAGFGFLGAVEEVDVDEIKEVMDTNFYGALHVTQAILPQFRQQSHGHLVQISSVAGFRATQGFGVYNASKFALEGISEALAQEVAPFNVHVTIVEPGPFRTKFAGESINRAKKKIPAYAKTAGEFEKAMEARNGKQDGDPAKAAEVIWQITNTDNPPLRLPLGQTAYNALRQKMTQLENDLKAWEHIAVNTSFEQ